MSSTVPRHRTQSRIEITRIFAFIGPHLLLALFFLVTSAAAGFALTSDQSSGLSSQDIALQIRTIADHTGQLAVVALGCVLVRCCGRIDLTVGATFLIAMSLMQIDGNVFVLAVLSIAIGVAIGLINGVLVSTSRHSSTLITLLNMCFLCGIFRTAFPTFVPDSFIAESFMKTGFVSDTFLPAQDQYVFATTTQADSDISGWIRVQDFVVVVMYILGGLLLLKTQPGRNLVVVGHGIQRAKLLGINVTVYLWFTFAICGGLAAVAGTFNTNERVADSVAVVLLLPLQAFAAIAIGQGDLRVTRPRLARILIGCALIQIWCAIRQMNHWPPECDTLMVTMILLVATLLPTIGKGFNSPSDLSDLNDVNDSRWTDGS